MARTTSTNFTGLLDFPIATASVDLFKKEDVQVLAQAVDLHDHTSGKGLPLGAGAIANGTITSAMIADATIAAADLAAGAASANIGTLSGELAGTLPSPTLKHVVNSVSIAASVAVPSPSTWTVYAQATSVVLAVGTYIVVAEATYQTTASSGGKAGIQLGFGSGVAGTILATGLTYINIDNQTWRIRMSTLVSNGTASFTPWLQVFATHVGTVSDGLCSVVKVA